MSARLQAVCLGLTVVCVTPSAWAEPVAFTNEAEFISAVEAQGYVYVLESFEDDEVWGTVRSTIAGGSFTAPALTTFSVRVSANTNTSAVTTSQGPPRTGQWAAYSLPHGSYATGTGCDLPGNCGDGLLASSDPPMRAFSGWVKGTFGGKLEVILNGDRQNPVGFPEVCDPSGENCVDYGLLAAPHKFFGVLDPAGFTRCELREVEGTAGDQKFIWCDDLMIAFSNPPPPLIRHATAAAGVADFRFKELALRGQYVLEWSSSLDPAGWDPVDLFTASTTETNRTAAIGPGLPRAHFRLRSP